MWRFLLAISLAAMLPASGQAVPMWTAERVAIPEKPGTLAEDQCRLQYYNICCGWLWYWTGYCSAHWHNWEVPPKYGTCFDLADCPGSCRHLTDVWWACKRMSPHGYFDLEVYCADDHGCPIGPPLAGAYDVWADFHRPWQHLSFESVELCPCDLPSGKFLVLITQLSAGYLEAVPYSDINFYNIINNCEAEWRCAGHSFVYQSALSYCDVYGVPGPMWVSYAGAGCTNYPPIPPGCHNYLYNTGFFTEWLIHCYISCQGPTEAEKETWSAVKGLYR